MKNSLFSIGLLMLCVFISDNVYSQNQSNQYVVYLSEDYTLEGLQNVANKFNSTIVIPPQPNSRLAVLEVISFPFPDPYDALNIINGIDNIIGGGNGHSQVPDEDEIDGGAENSAVGNHLSADRVNTTCYNYDNLRIKNLENEVNLAIIDTGVEYELARQSDYTFKYVTEINGEPIDLNGHGTHVGGIIDFTFHSNIGDNNLNYQISNTFGATGQANSLYDVLYDIETAILNGSNIINCSFSYVGYSDSHDAFYELINDHNDVLFVASAGNNGLDMDDTNGDFIKIPSCLPNDNIISVASYNGCEDYQLSSFSNYGVISVDIAAPGENIVSINENIDPYELTGTSQSTAFVSSVAASLATYLETFDPLIIKCAIMSGADPSPLLNGKVASGGTLNAKSALTYLNQCELNNIEENATPPINTRKSLTSNLAVYPNPASDQVNISFDSEENSFISIDLISLTGEVIKSIKHEVYSGSNEIFVDLGSINVNGLYLLSLKSNEFKQVRKLYIE